MKTGKRWYQIGIIAGTSLLLGGCCDEVCDALDDMNAHIAFQYAACCQAGGDTWGTCVTNAAGQTNQLRAILIQAETACRNGQRDLARQLLREFYQLLRGQITEVIGPGQQVPRGDSIFNTYKAMHPDELIAIDLTGTPTGTTTISVPTMSVGGVSYLNAASGPAVQAFIMLNPSDPAPIAVAEPEPVGGRVVSHYAISAGTIGVDLGVVDETMTIDGGTASFVSIGSDGRMVPTAFSLDLQNSTMKLGIRLDPSCPYNGLWLDANGEGHFRAAVSFQTSREELFRLVHLGPFWMEVPVSKSASTGVLTFSTGGLVSGTAVFPVQESTLSVLQGQAGTAGLPNGQAESCADADNNGIRDGADELININNMHASDCN